MCVVVVCVFCWFFCMILFISSYFFLLIFLCGDLSVLKMWFGCWNMFLMIFCIFDVVYWICFCILLFYVGYVDLEFFLFYIFYLCLKGCFLCFVVWNDWVVDLLMFWFCFNWFWVIMFLFVFFCWKEFLFLFSFWDLR